MNLFKYFLGFLIVIIIGQIYNKYKHKIGYNTIENNNYLINKYLLNNNNEDINLNIDQKPLLWIYTNINYNSRVWKSFYSRSSYDINQPYINLCINTIVEKCSDSFNVFLINDQSFSDILIDWDINFDTIPEPLKTNYRNLALCKILYLYGGFVIPSSFICKTDMIELYNTSIYNTGFFTCEIPSKIYYANLKKMTPTFLFLGAEQKNPHMYDVIKNLEVVVSTEFTNENKFMGINEEILYKHINQKTLTLVDGSLIGTKDKYNNTISIDNLLGDSYIYFNTNIAGIYISEEDVLTRTKYQWFSVLPIKDILESNMILSKHILLSCN